MERHFEQRIVHNPAFGASTLWHFVSKHQAAEPSEFPDLPLLYIVLPLVMNRRAAEALAGVNFDGGLLRALDRLPDLIANLSDRIQDLRGATLASINLATASGLLIVEPTERWPAFRTQRASLPADLKPAEEHLKAIHAAARRLGYSTAREERTALWAYLDLRL